VKPYQEVALAFATSLIERDFSRARGMLAPGLRAKLTEADLEEQLTAMYRSYADGQPEHALLIPEGTAEEWPAKEPGDIGFAYVSISGEDFNEAVSVIVSDIVGALVIREIEWGRP
jgi:hypothetical protein